MTLAALSAGCVWHSDSRSKTSPRFFRFGLVTLECTLRRRSARPPICYLNGISHANGRVARPSVALPRGRQGSPQAAEAGDACAVRVRTVPGRAPQNLARRDSRLEANDESGDPARRPASTSPACDRAASARGGRPARRPRNAVPRPWACGSSMAGGIMAQDHQVLLDDRRRPPRRAARALVEAALRLVSAAHEPSFARARGARRRSRSRGHPVGPRRRPGTECDRTTSCLDKHLCVA